MRFGINVAGNPNFPPDLCTAICRFTRLVGAGNPTVTIAYIQWLTLILGLSRLEANCRGLKNKNKVLQSSLQKIEKGKGDSIGL